MVKLWIVRIKQAVVRLVLLNQHPRDVGDTPKCDCVQHIHRKLPQEMILRLIRLKRLPILILFLILCPLQQPQPHHQVVCVVVTLNDLKLISTCVVSFLDFCHHFAQLHFLCIQSRVIKNEPKHPRRHILFGGALELIVALHDTLILRNVGLQGVGLVVYFGMLDDTTEVEVLNLVGDDLGLVGVDKMFLLEVNRNARCLDVLGNVDQLLHSRHSLSALLGTHARKVKGVESHLGHGLAERL
mmetsp:Transcript_11744/g.28483  ORF Transcript_11744/g.28483 Transcript_11744/m.28483 type:complete len:242 (-) Transcript_11744:2954-3679(-)